MAANRHAIRGRVLETGAARYGRRHRGPGTMVDVVSGDARNLGATVLADVSRPGSLPAATYDCVILAHAVATRPHADAALCNGWRAVAPGGVLLAAVPSSALPEDAVRSLLPGASVTRAKGWTMVRAEKRGGGHG